MKKTFGLFCITCILFGLLSCPSDQSTNYIYDSVVPANSGYGIFKTISIDGINTSGEWGSSTLLITDPAADDARFLGTNWCAHMVPEDYTQLHAAWDSNYLYIGIQFVNVTDWIEPANASSSQSPLLTASTIPQTVMINTVAGSGYSTGGDALASGHTFIGVEQPEFQLHFQSNAAASGIVLEQWNGTSWNIIATGSTLSDLTGAAGNLLIGNSISGVSPAEDDKDPGNYGSTIVEYLGGSSSHSTSVDSYFELKVPLSLLGISADRLNAGCIGLFAYCGASSAVDSIPHDFATSSTPGLTASNAPNESDDTLDDDAFSSVFALVGQAPD